MLPVNNARAERQQDLPIQVIVGNPPWSAKQKTGTDDNPNVEYPELEQRIRETYAARSPVDEFKTASTTHIRWQFDGHQIDFFEQGIIAFVTNGSWIDTTVDAGVRSCLAEEF